MIWESIFSALFFGNIATVLTQTSLLVATDSESRGTDYSRDLDEAGKFLKNFDVKADELMTKNAQANWEYETDLSEKNLQKTVDIGLELSEFFLENSENAGHIKTLDLPSTIHRQISLIRRSADPTSEQMRREIKETIGHMTSIFGKSKVQKKNSSKNYTLSDLNEILKKSRNRKELNWAWDSWRDKVGPPIRPYFTNLVDLLNVGAREHGWIDYGDFLRSDYEMGDDFELSLNNVWKDVEPLYKELHAYVRYKISKKYNLNIRNGLIPANLLGDMFAQDWVNIYDLIKPNKKSKTFDVTQELKKQKYNVTKMFQLAEQFFISIGLDKMPDSFWKNSVFTKIPNKEMVCHASAWDVSKTDDRIKMCAKVKSEDLTTIHHEMGHIEYFLAYKNQPNTFRAGANPGFHEAIGDTISLSVETTSYLHQVGLVKKETSGKDDIGFLLNQALRRLAPLPYNFLVDKWRWRVFEGNITENTYNSEWWKLRVKYQGVEPPVLRTTNAFDPASKYHIGANVPYVAYFVSYVLQFQLHKALCKEAGYNGLLHKCSIYKSEKAGKKLKTMLEKGRSEPWPIILNQASGEKDLKAKAIVEYFEPLRQWLVEQRESKKYPLGWTDKMSTKVLQRKSKKYEPGQERSGILKTNSGDVSLSINIPSVSLNDLIGKKNSEVNRDEGDIMKLHNITAPAKENLTPAMTASQDNLKQKTVEEKLKSLSTSPLDLAKLISSGGPLSIKSSETTATNKEGATEINQKEIDINAMGENSKTNNSPKEPTKMTQDGINNTTLALLQQVLAGKINITESSNSVKSTKPLEKKPVVPQINVPVAANLKPENEFPLSAVPQQEAKENPKAAGIKYEPLNPTAAAVSEEPKPNPVPPNQIALLPVALPQSLLAALKKAFNSTNKTNAAGNENNIDLTSLQGLINASSSQKKEGEVEQKLSEATSAAPQKNESELATMNESAAELNNVQGLLNHLSTENLPSQPAIQNVPAQPAIQNVPTQPVAQNIPNQPVAQVVPNQATGQNIANQHVVDANVDQPINQNTENQATSQTLNPVENAANVVTDTIQNESSPNIYDHYNSYYQNYYAPYNQTNGSNMYNTTPVSQAVTNSFLPVDTNPFFTTQMVRGCKKDGSPCMQSKITSEGNSFPTAKAGIDESRQTVSVSPSLLIQKLIEHHVADKSTPDPVVNAVPDSPKKDVPRKSPLPAPVEPDNKSAPTEYDIGKIIKALTGTVAKNLVPAENQNQNQNRTSIIANRENTNPDIKPIVVENKPESNVDFLESLKNCSDLMKRGVSLNFNCNNPRATHRGGTLSISPTELVQRLLESKVKTEVSSRKTLPSAHVVKTPNGFQLNFDLNPKNKAQDEIADKTSNSVDVRQQHVNVYNTPKGMVVKPKSSLQLLTPQFVPIQNKDNLELGNKRIKRKVRKRKDIVGTFKQKKKSKEFMKNKRHTLRRDK